MTCKAEQDGGRQNTDSELQELFLLRVIIWGQLIELSETMVQHKVCKVDKNDENDHGQVVVDIGTVDCAHTTNCEV